MHKRTGLLLGLCTALVFSGCGGQSIPSVETTGKDLDKLVEDAAGENTDVVMPEGDQYQLSYESTEQGVVINIDASLQIPDVSSLKMYKVEQKEISQDEIDYLRGILAPNVQFMDGGQMADYSSGTMIAASKLAEKNTDFYTWAYSLNKNGTLLYEKAIDSNGNYISIYAQNNAARGNALRFSSSTLDYLYIAVAFSGDSVVLRDEDTESWAGIAGIEVMPDAPGESCTISEAQAIELADAFLEDMGYEDFALYDKGVSYEWMDIRYDNEEEEAEMPTYQRKVHVLTYFRTLDGIMVSNCYGTKYDGNWDGDEFIKQEWAGERITILVNDNGIVYFGYSAPLNILETVADSVKVMDFEKIEEIYLDMVAELAVPSELKDEIQNVNIQVDRVALEYTRISEKDDYSTGLLVPAWNFYGTRTYVYEDGYEYAEDYVFCINAVDGSVVDGTLGY